ncbi:MAG: hypothetical protein WB439_02080 [Acidobacteriaceae bacterium]
MKIPTYIVASLILMAPMASSAKSKTQASEPTAWGMLSPGAPCLASETWVRRTPQLTTSTQTLSS